MIKKILLPLLAVLMLSILGITFLLQTEHVKKLVEKEISTLIEKQTGSPIKIAGLHLQFPLIVEAESIHSEQFNLRDIYIKLSVLNLMRGDIVIRKFIAESLEVPAQHSANTTSAIKNLPHFHVDFFSIKSLHYNAEIYSLEGEIHSGNVFSGSLQIAFQKDLQHPFYFAINGLELDEGITAQLLCQYQEDYIEGSLTLKGTEIALEHVDFSIKGIQGEGSVYLNNKREWDGSKVKLTIDDLHHYCNLAGDAKMEVSLFGDFFEPHFELTSLSRNLVLKEIACQDSLIQLKGHWTSEFLKATLQGQSFHDQNRIDGSCQLLWNHQQTLFLTDMQFSTDEISCAGNCSIHLDTHLIQGHLNGTIPRYKTSYSLTLEKDQDNKQCGHIAASSTGLIYNDGSFSKLNLTASFTDILKFPKGTIKLLCENYDSEIVHLKQLDLESTIDLSNPSHPFSFRSNHDKGFFQATGAWNMNLLEVVRCSGEILNYPFTLKDSFLLTFDSDSCKTTPIEVYLHDGMILGSFEKNADLMHIQAEIQKLPLELLQLSSSAPRLRGDADLVLSLSGPKSNLEGSLDIHLSDVEILEDIQPPLPPFNAKLKATLSNQSLSCLGELTGRDLNPIRISGHFKEEYISLHFEAKDEITQFIQLLFLQNAVHMTGEVSVLLDVEGTLHDPVIHGEVIWTNGTFEHPETGILYKEIAGSLTATGKQLILNQMKAIDLEGGTLTGSGAMQLSSELFYPFSLDLLIQNTQLLNLDYATATGNGTLKLSGTIQEALLSGKIQADSIKVRIPDETRPNIPTIAVNYINQSSDEIAPTSAYRPPTTWPIGLDLACEIKKPISIKAKNLRSTWNGNLHIKGYAANPLLYGDFKVISGEYNFRGKIFEIKEGSIFFSGDKNTSLYVVGSQDIDDIQADVIFKGPLKSPVLSFRSNPPMPQREIVSYILFGHSSSDLTPFQGTELSESITDLDTTHKPDLLSRISEKIGIDKIDISSSDVKVGKYISKGVLISLDKSMNAEANRVSIEAKVIKDIKFEGQIGDDAEGQLNIKWKKDY